MNDDLHSISILAASASSLAANFSGICAFLSYRLSQKIRNELKSDERIIFGPFQKPQLLNHEHSNCVIVCTLFNKSRRKAYVELVKATDDSGNEIDITWSSTIDECGNPQDPFGLMGVVDSNNLFIRRMDGEAIENMSLHIAHSFSESPEIINYTQRWSH